MAQSMGPGGIAGRLGLSLLMYGLAALAGCGVMLALTGNEGILSASLRNTVGVQAPEMLEGYLASAAAALTTWIIVVVALGWLLAAVFLIVTGLAKPRTPAEEAGAGGLWWGLLIGSVVLACGWSWWSLSAQGAATDLNGMWIGPAALVAVVLLVVIYYVCTALLVPDSMRPSVPGGHNFARRAGR